MPYNELLAERIRRRLRGVLGVDEKKVFGGIAFLIRGNMAVGVHKDDLIVRVHPSEHGHLLKKPGARPFTLTGRSMAGWVLVSAQSLKPASALHKWIEISLRFVEMLPAK